MNQIGKIICARRIEKNWNQEELCKGICAVSYLSKIEKGKAEPSQEIVAKLLERLGITIDEEKEQQAKQTAEQAYEYVFSAMNREFRELLGRTDIKELEGTRYAIDLKLLEQLASSEMKPLNSSAEASMDLRQKAVQKVLSGSCEEALLLYPNAWMYLMSGIDAYEKGKINDASDYLNTAYDMGAKEGTVRILLSAALYQYRCAAAVHDFAKMKEISQRARRIAVSLNERNTLFMIEYNMALASLGAGDYEEAYEFFSSLDKPNSLSLLFLAVCCEKTDRREEARSAIDEANADSPHSPLIAQCLKLVSCRLDHPDYLDQEEYGNILKACRQSALSEPVNGTATLITRWLLEWYQATRQYKKAFELLADEPWAAQ